MLPSSGHKTSSNMRLNNWPKNPKTQFLIFALIFTLILYLTFNLGKSQIVSNFVFSRVQTGQLTDNSERISRDLPLLKFPDLSPTDFHQLCFPSLPLDTTIGNTFAKLQALWQSEHQVCQDIAEVASRIYRFSKSTGEVVLPDGFVSDRRSSKGLNGNEKLFESIRSQFALNVLGRLHRREQNLWRGFRVKYFEVKEASDYEYLIISQKLGPDSIKLLWRVLQTYRNKLGVYCFSSGGSLPVIGSPRSGLHFIFRIGSRGDCSSLRSDVSSLELYTVNNINTDLNKTVQALKDS